MERTIERLSAEDLQRLFELYQNKCKNNGWIVSVRDFIIWLAEEGYIDED